MHIAVQANHFLLYSWLLWFFGLLASLHGSSGAIGIQHQKTGTKPGNGQNKKSINQNENFRTSALDFTKKVENPGAEEHSEPIEK